MAKVKTKKDASSVASSERVTATDTLNLNPAFISRVKREETMQQAAMAQKLRDDLMRMKEDELFPDLEFSMGSHSIPGHRLIVQTRLQAINDTWCETSSDNPPILHLTHTTVDEAKEFLKELYTSDDVNPDLVMKTLNLRDKDTPTDTTINTTANTTTADPDKTALCDMPPDQIHSHKMTENETTKDTVADIVKDISSTTLNNSAESETVCDQTYPHRTEEDLDKTDTTNDISIILDNAARCETPSDQTYHQRMEHEERNKTDTINPIISTQSEKTPLDKCFSHRLEENEDKTSSKNTTINANISTHCGLPGKSISHSLEENEANISSSINTTINPNNAAQCGLPGKSISHSLEEDETNISSSINQNNAAQCGLPGKSISHSLEEDETNKTSSITNTVPDNTMHFEIPHDKIHTQKIEEKETRDTSTSAASLPHKELEDVHFSTGSPHVETNSQDFSLIDNNSLVLDNADVKPIEKKEPGAVLMCKDNKNGCLEQEESGIGASSQISNILSINLETKRFENKCTKDERTGNENLPHVFDKCNNAATKSVTREDFQINTLEIPGENDATVEKVTNEPTQLEDTSRIKQKEERGNDESSDMQGENMDGATNAATRMEEMQRMDEKDGDAQSPESLEEKGATVKMGINEVIQFKNSPEMEEKESRGNNLNADILDEKESKLDERTNEPTQIKDHTGLEEAKSKSNHENSETLEEKDGKSNHENSETLEEKDGKSNHDNSETLEEKDGKSNHDNSETLEEKDVKSNHEYSKTLEEKDSKQDQGTNEVGPGMEEKDGNENGKPSPLSYTPCSGLAEDLLQCYLRQDFTDCTLRVEDQTFVAHRCILAARCQYFEAMFMGSWAESDETEIELHGLNGRSLKYILLYVYGGMVEVPVRDITSLMQGADMLGVEGLKEWLGFLIARDYCHFFHKPCQDCIRMVPDVLILVTQFNLTSLCERGKKWVASHFRRIWEMPNFGSLPPVLLEECTKAVIDQMTIQNITQMILDSHVLVRCLQRNRRAPPVQMAAVRVMDEALAFCAKHFATLVQSPNFLSWSKDGAWCLDVLEESYTMVVSLLQPQDACHVYASLTALIDSCQNPDHPLASSEEVQRLLNKLVERCEWYFHRYIHRVAQCPQWSQLPSHLQQQLLQKCSFVPAHAASIMGAKSRVAQKSAKVLQDNIVHTVTMLCETDPDLFPSLAQTRKILAEASQHPSRPLDRKQGGTTTASATRTAQRQHKPASRQDAARSKAGVRSQDAARSQEGTGSKVVARSQNVGKSLSGAGSKVGSTNSQNIGRSQERSGLQTVTGSRNAEFHQKGARSDITARSEEGAGSQAVGRSQVVAGSKVASQTKDTAKSTEERSQTAAKNPQKEKPASGKTKTPENGSSSSSPSSSSSSSSAGRQAGKGSGAHNTPSGTASKASGPPRTSAGLAARVSTRTGSAGGQDKSAAQPSISGTGPRASVGCPQGSSCPGSGRSQERLKSSVSETASSRLSPQASSRPGSGRSHGDLKSSMSGIARASGGQVPSHPGSGISPGMRNTKSLDVGAASRSKAATGKSSSHSRLGKDSGRSSVTMTPKPNVPDGYLAQSFSHSSLVNDKENGVSKSSATKSTPRQKASTGKPAQISAYSREGSSKSSVSHASPRPSSGLSSHSSSSARTQGASKLVTFQTKPRTASSQSNSRPNSAAASRRMDSSFGGASAKPGEPLQKKGPLGNIDSTAKSSFARSRGTPSQKSSQSLKGKSSLDNVLSVSSAKPTSAQKMVSSSSVGTRKTGPRLAQSTPVSVKDSTSLSSSSSTKSSPVSVKDSTSLSSSSSTKSSLVSVKDSVSFLTSSPANTLSEISAQETETVALEEQTSATQMETTTPEKETVALDVATTTPDLEMVTPDVETIAPEEDTDAPETKTVAPEVKPDTTENETVAPEMKASTPEMERDATESGTSAPHVETTSPEMKAPAPEMETVAPVMETGVPEMETDVPEMETVTTEMETGVPEMETAALEMETVTTEMETSAVKLEKDASEIQAAAPEMD